MTPLFGIILIFNNKALEEKDKNHVLGDSTSQFGILPDMDLGNNSGGIINPGRLFSLYMKFVPDFTTASGNGLLLYVLYKYLYH